MSYKVSYRDKTSAVISEEDGDNLKLILLGQRKPDNVEINGDVRRTSEIVGVTKAFATQDPIPDFTLPAIPANRCRAQYSIQKEVNNIAKATGNQWAKLIKDKKWREETRLKLREANKEWCDYRAKECVCDELSQSQQEAA